MALYERNSIHYSEEEKDDIVYVSYPCEDDGEYDYLALGNINKVTFCSSLHSALNLTTNSSESAEIHYNCDYVKSKDQSNVYMSASIGAFVGDTVKIELQTFVDKIAESIYNLKTIDECEEIAQAKDEALLKLKRNYFNITGNIITDTNYNVVGKITDGNSNVVGIINSFTALQSTKNISIALNNCIGYMSLKDIVDPIIEFTTGHIKLIISDFEIVSSVDGILRDYEIKINIARIEFSNEPSMAISVSDINDQEQFFDERADLLSDRDKVFTANNSIDNVDTLFDDFDFDF